MKVSELLISDISRLVKKAEALTEDYEANADILHELMESKLTAPLLTRPSTITLKLPPYLSLKWTICGLRLDKEPGLTDVDKSYLLVEAMADPKAQQRAAAAIAHTSSYDDAIKELKV